MGAKLLLLVFALLWSTPLWAAWPDGLTLGGLVRAGGFALDGQTQEQAPAGPSFQEKQAENSLGSYLLVEHWLNPLFFYGYQYHHYLLSIEGIEETESIRLNEHFFTIGGAWRHQDRRNRVYRVGLVAGVGQASYKNQYFLHPSDGGEDQSWSFKSQGNLVRLELFFQAQISSGWGYRAGYATQSGKTQGHLNGSAVDLSASPFLSMTLIWTPKGF
ncbi:MAG: hypothetical protein RRB13_08490 [bacterium]|nr:hypothetical protein [bacterium]